MRRLPPLNSIRAFEATARHLSFSKAANELNVTAGAVSQQVKVLEDYLNFKLFKRKNRMILLTDEAQMCLPLLSEGLDKLSQGIDSIRAQSNDKPLTITASNTFASRWLLPRLTHFHKKYPDIDIRIEASNVLSDLINDDIDIGIRFGDGNYPGLEAEYLFSQRVIPVCHPSLIEGDNKILVPEDLKKHTLLHPGIDSFYLHDNTHIDWGMWFATVGVEDIDLEHGLHYEQYSLLLDAVLAGQGVALVGDSVVSDDINAGRLIKLFENTDIKLNFSYYLAYSKSKANLPRLQIFRQWLLEQVKEIQSQEP